MKDLKSKKPSLINRLRTTTVRGIEKKELTAFWKGVDKYLSALGGIIRVLVRVPLAVLVAVQTGLEAFFEEMGR